MNRTRAAVAAFLDRVPVRNFIIIVIVINAITLGLETSEGVMSRFGPVLKALDLIALTIFIVEIALRLFAYGWRFFRDPWNLFDFFVVAVAVLPVGEGISVLRALRILRALRLVSAVPKMRQIVGALIASIPALGSVTILMSLLFYVFAVLSTKLYGATFEQWFGSIGASLYSLFQIMTLESWSMGIVRPVLEVHPYAWLFFVPFILITSFAVLNLFIAVIVNAMQSAEHEQTDHIEQVVERLEAKIDNLAAKLEERK